MDNTELSELLAELAAQGYRPLACDTPVSSYENSVRAGLPTSPGDVVSGDYVLLPKSLLGHHPEFIITVQGDSMQDANIHSGDRLRVMVDADVSDGDIVVVSIDGDCTVKTLFQDEQGRQWLVPANDNYKPLLLTPDMNVRMVGRVVECMHRTPRLSYRECLRKVRRAQSATADGPSAQLLDEVLREAATMVASARQWFAVYRALVDHHIVNRDDYRGFIELLDRAVTDNPCPPNAAELRRMATLSFSKSVALWESSNAPVTGQRFYDYLRIARHVSDRLG